MSTFIGNAVTLQTAADTETETLVALLEDALTREPTRRAMLADTRLTSYVAYCDGGIVGAAVIRWGTDSEIELLAIVAALLGEAQQRGVSRLLVGTGNFSLDNIAFYQKCGFRMSHVRRGWFDAVDPPEFWQGIKLRDMIVFDCELEVRLSAFVDSA